MTKDDTTSTHRQFAELLDSKFRIPNTDIRYGVDSLIGLIPGAGDWLGGAVSLYFLFYAAWLGGKASVLARMFIIILLDVLVGAIPVLGDAFDVYWKANERNAEIIRELEENPDETTTESRLWVWLVLVQFMILVIAALLLIGWIITEVLELLLSLL